jgi:raffinose/stachyose/melibiose transport system permease protein
VSSAGAGTTVSLARQPDAAAGRTPPKGGGRGPRRPSGLPWILPAFVFVVGLVYYCIGYTGYISTLTWDGVSPSPAHVGFANYITAFHDPVFWDAIRHTIIFFVVTFCVQTALGLAFAALLHSKVKLPNLYKVIIFVPVVLAPATMAPIFRQIFSATGQFNTILGDIGLGSLEHPWLAQSSTALPVIMAITIWEWTGVTFILYFAAMTQIDSEILEASVRGTTIALAMLSVIGALKTFDVPYLVTLGGPNYATEFLGTFIYRISIPQAEVGYGAALSILLLILALSGAVAFGLRGMRRN